MIFNFNKASKTVGVLLVLFMGCIAREDSRNAEVRRMGKDIETMIAEIPQTITTERWKAEELGISIWKKIDALPDNTKRIELCRKAFDVTFNVDLSHLPFGHQYSSIRTVEEIYGRLANAWCRTANPQDRFAVERRERQWDSRFMYLSWVKKQITRCKGEYAEIEPKTHVRPIPLSIANRALGLKNLIEFITYDFEARIARHERDFWEYMENAPSESWTAVKRKFEEIIERPIRTLEQIEADRQRKAEAFRRAEEAARSDTNRPPPLILIDGDL